MGWHNQLTAIKVRPLTTAEKASYLKWELYWHHEEGDPLPDKTLGERGFEYMVIGGHRRREGALLAGFETLDCIVLNVTPEETHLASLMDNNQEEMDWWDWDLAIEKEHNIFPDMPQRELGKRLGKSKTKVGNALLLAKVMNEESRQMIGNNLDPTCDNDGFRVDLPAEDPDTEDNLAPSRGKTPSPGTPLAPRRGNIKTDYRITEVILLALAGLKDPEMIEYAIEEILIKEMPLVQVKKLVEWVNDGNDLYDFDSKGGSNGKSKEEDPLAEDWKDLGPGIKVKYKGGEDYEIHLTESGGDKALKTARAAQKAIRGGIF
jgi:hypothetical protein